MYYKYAVRNLCIQFNIKVYEVICICNIRNLIHAFMKFNMHWSVDKTGYFLDSLIICKSLKLVNDISNQFNHQYYRVFS